MTTTLTQRVKEILEAESNLGSFKNNPPIETITEFKDIVSRIPKKFNKRYRPVEHDYVPIKVKRQKTVVVRDYSTQDEPILAEIEQQLTSVILQTKGAREQYLLMLNEGDFKNNMTRSHQQLINYVAGINNTQTQQQSTNKKSEQLRTTTSMEDALDAVTMGDDSNAAVEAAVEVFSPPSDL